MIALGAIVWHCPHYRTQYQRAMRLRGQQVRNGVTFRFRRIALGAGAVFAIAGIFVGISGSHSLPAGAVQSYATRIYDGSVSVLLPVSVLTLVFVLLAGCIGWWGWRRSLACVTFAILAVLVVGWIRSGKYREDLFREEFTISDGVVHPTSLHIVSSRGTIIFSSSSAYVPVRGPRNHPSPRYAWYRMTPSSLGAAPPSAGAGGFKAVGIRTWEIVGPSEIQNRTNTGTHVSIEYWVLTVTCALVLMFLGFSIVRTRRRAGHCIECGYDLRASEHRCPECGREIDKGPES